MRISIIGAGNVGQALATAFIRRGQAVTFGVTDPDQQRPRLAALGDQVRIASVQQAVAAGDIVILAVPYVAAAAIADSIPDWQGKIIVDATNPLAPGLAGLTLGTTTSGAEETARRARNARVVKAFNSTGAENMGDSHYPGGRLAMPVCGDDPQARDSVMALAALIGFEPLDFGPLAAARYLEPLAMAWIHLAFQQGQGRDFAFSVVRRKSNRD